MECHDLRDYDLGMGGIVGRGGKSALSQWSQYASYRKNRRGRKSTCQSILVRTSILQSIDTSR